MIIIGAGMAGLLCGALNPGSIIYEAGPEKEENHQALFRCRSDQIGKVLGIDFKEVIVNKAIWYKNKEVDPTPRFAHMYSKKVSGKITGRSILDTKQSIRFVPPYDFISRLKERCQINYSHEIKRKALDAFCEPIVSTMPMFKILELLDFEQWCNFDSKPIFVNKFRIEKCDSYCTIYYPDPNLDTYRASLTGDILTVESMEPNFKPFETDQIFESFGITDCTKSDHILQNKRQQLGKITPIDNKLREHMITNLTLNHQIYSLGRFATWRPKVMLDDVLEDIYHIRRLIQGGSYAALKHQQNEEN